MMEDDSAASSAADTASMKRTETGIILHPQPHDNPNDPLNWPTIRKDICFLIIGFQTFIGGGQTPILASAFSSLAEEFNEPISVISYLVGGFMLALGVGSVFASPTAVLYGKRLVYLLGILIFLIGAIIAAAAPNYGTLMAGRILTGFGASPTESLTSASLSELYFQHERAYRTGLYTLLLLGGKNIIPLLSSLMFEHLGRHWMYWILAMFLGLNLILTFLFVPETFWERSPTPNKRSLQETEAARRARNYIPPEQRPHAYALPSSGNVVDTDSLASSRMDTTIHEDGHREPVGIINDAETHIDDGDSLASTPKSFKNRLALTSGRHTPDKWWQVALRPFFLYLYPSVLYGSLVYSMAVVWLIVISETVSEIFKGEEYGYSSQTVGLFYLGPFIGGVLGSLTTGFIGDRLVRYFASKNHGIYEPEFRLIMLIPATILECFGLMGYGWSAEDTQPWIAPVIFFSCLSFGSSMASTTAITYTVDCYKMFAAEALVSFNFAKNFLGFIFSLFNTDVYFARGGKDTFVIYGVVQMFLSLCGIGIYMYGKKFRAWTDDKELLRMLYAHPPSSEAHEEKEKVNEEEHNESETELATPSSPESSADYSSPDKTSPQSHKS
ncbi:hypothetical protein FT663_00526 [Candidozyma haemuli var. vulneris]|nr:hypothetical protein FT662_00632 [[Candida] haemuloni var. vulneris]KAF3995308.1 hypothetical protein FT663_00526 [[Candida] haemuloni var. vulneris]